jgi:hypothetical protein
LKQRDVVIIHPERRGSCRELARRIHAALTESGRSVELRSSLDPTRSEKAPVLLAVGEFPDAGLPPARRRIAVVSGETRRRSFPDFDAVFDVSLVPQPRPPGGAPYRFIPDAPTAEERSALTRVRPSGRPLPWVLFGLCHGAAEAALLHELVRFDPGGLAYMPQAQLLREHEDPVSPASLAAVASKVSYYIWHSGESAPFESAHYRRALMGGAAPCRLGDKPLPGVPGSYGSVERLCEEMRGGNPREPYEKARSF